MSAVIAVVIVGGVGDHREDFLSHPGTSSSIYSLAQVAEVAFQHYQLVLSREQGSAYIHHHLLI